MITWNRTAAGDGERWVHVRCVSEFEIDIPGENMRTSKYQPLFTPSPLCLFFKRNTEKVEEKIV